MKLQTDNNTDDKKNNVNINQNQRHEIKCVSQNDNINSEIINENLNENNNNNNNSNPKNINEIEIPNKQANNELTQSVLCPICIIDLSCFNKWEYECHIQKCTTLYQRLKQQQQQINDSNNNEDSHGEYSTNSDNDNDSDSDNDSNDNDKNNNHNNKNKKQQNNAPQPRVLLQLVTERRQKAIKQDKNKKEWQKLLCHDNQQNNNNSHKNNQHFSFGQSNRFVPGFKKIAGTNIIVDGFNHFYAPNSDHVFILTLCFCFNCFVSVCKWV